MELTVFKATSKITLFKRVIQNFEEDIFNDNLMSLNTLQMFNHVHM